MKLHHHKKISGFSNSGFTLLELIVVIGIIALTSTVAFFNFRTLQKDQSLLNSTNDLVAFMRLAQSNAKAQVQCGTSKSYGWAVFVDTSFKLYCITKALPTDPIPWYNTGTAVKSLNLAPSIVIDSIPSGCAATPLQIEFSPLYGDAKFRTGSGATSYAVCGNALGIRLRSNIGGDKKDVIINTAGAVDIQDVP